MPPEQSGQTPGQDQDQCSAMVMFTHASTLDAFVLAATAPSRMYTLAKKELLLVPFFNYLLLTFGGVPIDRKNR